MPVILKLKDNYNLWQQCLAIFPKTSRFTLGAKIDKVFLDAIEYSFLASYANINDRSIIIDKCSVRVDLIKLFLMLAWEIKAIDTNQYTNLSQSINETGKQLGGWKKSLTQKTPESVSREKIR